MKYLKEIIEGIASKSDVVSLKEIAKQYEKDLTSEISNISNDDLDELVSYLYPKEIQVNIEYYNNLEDIVHIIGYNENSKKFVGLLWAYSINKLKNSDKEDLLNILFNSENKVYWNLISSFPTFCDNIIIDHSFFENWLHKFATLVQGDFASGDFYIGLEKYVLKNYIEGLYIFESYIDDIKKGKDDIKLNISSLILGILRLIKANDKGFQEKVSNWDDLLIHSENTILRICYYKSLFQSFKYEQLSIDELDKNLSVLINGDEYEITESFNLLYRCILYKNNDDEFISYALKWLKNNTTPKISDNAKYFVVDALWRVCSNYETLQIDITKTNSIIKNVFPLHMEHHGTWNQLEYYMVDRLKQGIDVFNDLINKLLNSDSVSLINKFESDGFSYIKSEIEKSDFRNIIIHNIFSTDKNKRYLSYALFQNISINYKEIEKQAVDEKLLYIILLEITKKLMLGEKKSIFLLFLEKYFRDVSNDLKHSFINTMLLEAINYPFNCLDSWKKIDNQSELLKKVIHKSDKYFENIKKLKDSPAVSFSFPGYKKAIEESYRKFSSEVSRIANEKSIFMNLVKNVKIIYGTQYSTTIDNKLSDPSDFSQVSSKIEMPRLEFIDPEGMALRRIQATIELNTIYE